MCGIAGFIDFNKYSSKETLENMINVLEHRGPDDMGSFVYNNSNYQVGLGHKRLSIIDLSETGHQPMFDETKKFGIILNGEIYNYKEIKKELVEKGYSFFSTSDTEVVLKSYMQWGEQAVNKFIGMFAFVIFDLKRQKVLLFRDRTGIKPLYYYWKNNLFLFASEIKSFHKHPKFEKQINNQALNSFFKYGYITSPQSIFSDIEKLMPGHFLDINLTKKSIQDTKYWDVLDFYNKPKLNISEEDAINELENLLKSAFNYRMVADVPVGVFLSGGYDSSLVAALLQSNSNNKIKTYTIGFNEKDYNEANYAKSIANYLGTEHQEYYCSSKEAIEIIPKLPEIFDEPFGDSSGIPTHLVSKIASKYVKVALSADGGDETFAGYNKYYSAQKIYDIIINTPNYLKPIIKKLIPLLTATPFLNNKRNLDAKIDLIKRLLEHKDISTIYRNKIDVNFFLSNEIQNILKQPLVKIKNNFDLFETLSDNNDNINKMLAIDYITYLPDDILVKVDRAAMSVSLEGRDPLLDHRIIEFTSQLPSNLKYKDGVTKYLLRQIVHKHIPRELIDRPKKGFGIPIDSWLRNDLKDLVMIHLSDSSLNRHNLFNNKEVIKIRDASFSSKYERPERLWFLLMFQMWHEKWM